MRVIQINTVCGVGSTGKIAVDLYHLASQAGYAPLMAYGRGSAPADIQSFKIGNTLDFGSHVLKNFFMGKSGFGSVVVTRRFLKWMDKMKPNLLHLHNLHGFYIHVEMLFNYIKQHNIPVIWTLHDCWPLTGQCAYFDYANCSKWQTACHHCPIYRSDYPYSLFHDNSRQNYILKKSSFTGVKNMIIVTPSNWLADIVQNSYLKEYPVRVVSNGIDLEIFNPGTSQTFNSMPDTVLVPSSAKIILGVANVWNRRKGLDFFLQLSDLLNASYHIVLIGLSPKQRFEIRRKYGKRITALTRTANQSELAFWYRHAYAYVNPTMEDNFPTTNLEALACGTPVITFNTGGSPECITPKCGIVVEKGNLEKLKEAILSLDRMTEITSFACHQRALKYNKNKCFHEYISIYNDLTSHE